MNILFTICGRAGSKGIKNKNLRLFGGKYLVYYSISVIDLYLKMHPEIIFDVVINTDSSELIKIVENNGLIKIDKIVRDSCLAGDTVGKISVIKDCLEKMEEKKGNNYDIVVDLDITSPLRTVKDLKRVIETHLEMKADVTTTVTTARRNPFFNQVKRTEHGVKKVIESQFTARQQAPDVFDMNASIYAYSPRYLRSGKGVLDGYCEVVEMYDTGVLDLDHENDFELMEVIAQYLWNSNTEFKAVFDHTPNLERGENN